MLFTYPSHIAFYFHLSLPLFPMGFAYRILFCSWDIWAMSQQWCDIAPQYSTGLILDIWYCYLLVWLHVCNCWFSFRLSRERKEVGCSFFVIWVCIARKLPKHLPWSPSGNLVREHIFSIICWVKCAVSVLLRCLCMCWFCCRLRVTICYRLLGSP